MTYWPPNINIFRDSHAYQSALFKFEGKDGFQAEYFQDTKLEGIHLLVRMEKTIDYRWGNGEQVADSLIACNSRVRFTSIFTPETSGEVAFELKGNDRSRLIIDGEKKIEADSKGSSKHSMLIDV